MGELKEAESEEDGRMEISYAPMSESRLTSILQSKSSSPWWYHLESIARDIASGGSVVVVERGEETKGEISHDSNAGMHIHGKQSKKDLYWSYPIAADAPTAGAEM